MSASYNKGTVFYIVCESGQPDRVFTSSGDARIAFEEPNISGEKIVVKAEVLRKKVQTWVEQEVQ